jgi:sugar lactone lactonase YvrE
MKLFETTSFTIRRTLCTFALASASAAATIAAAQTPTLVPVPFVTTIAGLAAGSGNTACTGDIPNNIGSHLGDGCLPTQATLATVYGAFTDPVGNIYISENGTNNDIRIIYAGGVALTAALIASNVDVPNFAPIPGRIYTLAGARAGALTVKNGTKYACNGIATGPVAIDSAGDGCPGTESYIKVRGVSVDASGNVFFVSTGGGNSVKVFYVGGTQVANLIATENPGVVAQAGYVYQLAGQSTSSYSGDGGLAKAAAFINVRDIVIDSAGNLYISDGNTAAAGNVVRRIDAVTGIITTYAGGAGCTEPTASCTGGLSGDGGPATAASLNSPYTLFFDRFNNLYISEYFNNRLRVVYAGGTIPGISSPVAGNIYTYAGGGALTANGTPANQLKLGSVQVAGIDPSGNIYLEDATSHLLWRFDASTSIGYAIGGLSSGSAAAKGAFCSGTSGPVSLDNFGDGCPALQASLSDIGRISFDRQGNFYTGENGNAIVRRYSYNTQFVPTAVGATTTQPEAYLALSAVTLATETFRLQGASTNEFSDAGTGTCAATSVLTAAQVCVFNVNFTPAQQGLRLGSVQLSSGGPALTTQLLSGLGLGSDLAIDPGTQTSAGTGLTPSGIAADLLGNVYVADQTGNRVLKGSSTATTLTPIVTGLGKPSGLALDSFGNLYIADTANNRIVETTSTGASIGTLGTGLSAPQGVAVDAFGNLFIADTGNNRIVEISPSGIQTVVPITGLSTPTQLTFDSLGDLFVADTGNARIVELPVNNTQITVALSPGLKPTAIAVDSAGTIYIADATSLQLLAFTPGSVIGNTLLTGLIKPAALAADPDGNLFLADAGLTSATYLRRSLGNITFPITNLGQASTASINLSNVGNAALTFPTTTLYTRTGSTAFTLAPSTSNGCAAGTPFAPGAGCNFTATFLPTAKGTATASILFNTNAVNTAAASALLTGSGQQLVATSTTLVVTSPTGTILYGQPVTLTATITPASNAGAATGTVTFTVDNRAQTPQPFGTGTLTLTLNPTVGTHTVSVTFSGDTIYASSSATATFTVNKSTTTTALSISSVNSNGAISLLFTATIASPSGTGETGTVSFFSGTQLLGTSTLNPTTRIATYSTTALTFPGASFTAVYSGDANFAGSTSTVFTPPPDFAIGSSASALSIPQGGVASLSFVIAALYGTTGTINPTCTGLPANSLCRFLPTTIPLSGSTPVQVQIFTNVNSNLASNQPLTPHAEFFLAGLFPLSLGLLAFGRRSRRLRSASLICFALLGTMFPFAGCGSGSSSAESNLGLVTPPGTYTVNIVFTGVAPLSTHTSTVALTVLPNNTIF